VEQMRKARGECKTNKKDADLLSLLPWEAKPWWRTSATFYENTRPVKTESSQWFLIV
jgi:hypothetical protein